MSNCDVRDVGCSYGWRLAAYKPYSPDKPFVTVSCDRYGGVSIVADYYYFYGDELPVVLDMVARVRELYEQDRKEQQDAWDAEVAKEIEVAEWPDSADEGKKLLIGGKCFQGYCTYDGLTARMHEKYGPCDVWYTERNGDPIGMVCPEGTPHERLPSSAMDYAALEWIKPEDDFGAGVVPAVYRRMRG